MLFPGTPFRGVHGTRASGLPMQRPTPRVLVHLACCRRSDGGRRPLKQSGVTSGVSWRAHFTRRPPTISASSAYDFCSLAQASTELAMAITKKRIAPSRKVRYEIGILPAAAAGVEGNRKIPSTASPRRTTATIVLMRATQYATVDSVFSKLASPWLVFEGRPDCWAPYFRPSRVSRRNISLGAIRCLTLRPFGLQTRGSRTIHRAFARGTTSM